MAFGITDFVVHKNQQPDNLLFFFPQESSNLCLIGILKIRYTPIFPYIKWRCWLHGLVHVIMGLELSRGMAGLIDEALMVAHILGSVEYL